MSDTQKPKKGDAETIRIDAATARKMNKLAIARGVAVAEVAREVIDVKKLEGLLERALRDQKAQIDEELRSLRSGSDGKAK